MERFLRSKLAFMGLILGSLAAVQAAHAADVYFSVGLPVSPPPVYVQPAPVYAAQHVYVQPAPVYVAPPYGYASDWERERAWEARRQQKHEWQERQRWREWRRWHDDD